MLVATVRNARTPNMGLGKVGGPSDGAWTDIDNSMCAIAVKEGWLYAVGDPNGIALMKHVSKYQAKVAGDTIVGKSKARIRLRLKLGSPTLYSSPSRFVMPQDFFTDPQVAAVGLTTEQATKKGITFKTVSTKMAWPQYFAAR